MKNKILFAGIFSLFGFIGFANASGYNVEDPLYLADEKAFISKSTASFGDSILLASQKFSYGINGIMEFGADIKYQQDFNSEADGFSNIGLDLVYRLSNSEIISDALFGLNFSKDSDVPEFSHTIYSTGLRLGRQWSRLTLAGTIKSSWIFYETDGYAYIDLMPEAYFKFNQMWGAGLSLDVRKATSSSLDRKWLEFKLTQKFGRTQYAEFIKYESETDEYTVGARINIVF